MKHKNRFLWRFLGLWLLVLVGPMLGGMALSVNKPLPLEAVLMICVAQSMIPMLLLLWMQQDREERR